MRHVPQCTARINRPIVQVLLMENCNNRDITILYFLLLLLISLWHVNQMMLGMDVVTSLSRLNRIESNAPLISDTSCECE